MSHPDGEWSVHFFTLQGKMSYPGSLDRVKFYPEISGQGKIFELFWLNFQRKTSFLEPKTLKKSGKHKNSVKIVDFGFSKMFGVKILPWGKALAKMYIFRVKIFSHHDIVQHWTDGDLLWLCCRYHIWSVALCVRIDKWSICSQKPPPPCSKM